MITKNPMQLKAFIKNKAAEKHISAQLVMQNYIGDNQISPDEGSEEVIDICFSNGDENTTSGYIKLTVGYLNFDEDGGAADGISDEVEYEYHDILKELDNFIYAQNCLIEKDTRIAEIISEAIKTNGDNT